MKDIQPIRSEKGAGAPIILLSGPRGVGKSTLCLRLAEELRQRGWPTAGIVTLAEERRRYVLDLSTGERRLLAAEAEILDGPTWKRFSFSQAGLDWGNTVVGAAVASNARLIILDEVGPLELVAGKGFAPALEALLDAPQAGLLVVRPELLQQVRKMARRRAIATWSVSLENRDRLPSQIAASLPT